MRMSGDMGAILGCVGLWDNPCPGTTSLLSPDLADVFTVAAMVGQPDVSATRHITSPRAGAPL